MEHPEAPGEEAPSGPETSHECIPQIFEDPEKQGEAGQSDDGKHGRFSSPWGNVAQCLCDRTSSVRGVRGTRESRIQGRDQEVAL